MDSPEIITVVLDPECGDGIFEFAQRGPVWVTHSDANRAAVEKYWKTTSDDANEVTSWSTPVGDGSEESWLGILDDLGPASRRVCRAGDRRDRSHWSGAHRGSSSRAARVRLRAGGDSSERLQGCSGKRVTD